jgi:hypothetical protein
LAADCSGGFVGSGSGLSRHTALSLASGTLVVLRDALVRPLSRTARPQATKDGSLGGG